MSTRDDIIRILKDPSLVTVTALVEYVEAQRADERAGWGTGDRWRHVQRVQRETRHHVAGLLASEPAERIREADGREFIALADAQRIAREDT